jgi:hypothetical protein
MALSARAVRTGLGRLASGLATGIRGRVLNLIRIIRLDTCATGVFACRVVISGSAGCLGVAGRLSAKGARNVILKEMRNVGLEEMRDVGLESSSCTVKEIVRRSRRRDRRYSDGTSEAEKQVSSGFQCHLSRFLVRMDSQWASGSLSLVSAIPSRTRKCGWGHETVA